MSNRFKFRAWHKEDQKMLVVVGVSYGINLETDCADIIGIDCAGVTDGRWKFAGADHDPDEVILMQSTGLKDKNGVEIFEGDVIECFSDTAVVGYSKVRGGYFPFANDEGCGCCSEFTASSECSEIIGNIHENPELLENK